MMKITFTRLLLFGFAMILWSAGANAQVTVTAASPYLETFDSFTPEASTFPSAPTSFTLQPVSAGWTNLTNDNFDWYAYQDDCLLYTSPSPRD